MQKLIRTYRSEGLSAVSVNVIPDQDSDVPDWIVRNSVDWPVLIGTNLAELGKLYRVTGAPETFILNRQRKILGWHVGYEPGLEKQIEAEIRLALGREPYD